MQIADGQTLVSASDLNNYLACRHLHTLNLALARGEIDERLARSATAQLLSSKGDEHENAYLNRLRDEGRQVVEIARPADSSIAALEARAAETLDAMRAGAEVIFQGTFFDGRLRGHTDFLFRVERPSGLGGWSYEVADTKLAKHPKPYFLIQLCFYSELLEKVQGGDPPESVHVILGTGEIETFRLAEFAAYYRRIRERFFIELESDGTDTYPLPVPHCSICGWAEVCDARRAADDHLSLVAGIRRSHVDALERAGVGTLAALGDLAPGTPIAGIRAETLAKVQAQARVQLAGRRQGQPVYELRETDPGRGLARLPRPSEGDVFFDFEGDPFYGERGLEYLFGYVTVESGTPEFTALWARDYAEEKRTFEAFIDFATERRRTYPDMHIYHYAPYEVTALKRLAGTHATRELELDQLLRDEVFVDLYKVVREGVRISLPSYSIKKVEAFYMDARQTEVTDGGDSVIQFEEWLDSGDDSILDAIAAYNEDDCVSTLKCRDWLLGLRQEAESQLGAKIEWPEPRRNELDAEAARLHEENAALRDALTAGVPDDPSQRAASEQARWLMAQLVDYHQREARPAWWAFFERLDYSDPDQFVEDPECIGGLRVDETEPPRQEGRSLVHHMTFEVQEAKLGVGRVFDPATGNQAGEIVAINQAEGRLELKRGPSLVETPLPRALIPGGPYSTPHQRAALSRLATDVLEAGLDSRALYSAGRDLLSAAPPRIGGIVAGEAIVRPGADLKQISEVSSRLEGSYLFVQGPPGAGKTYTASHLIADLVTEGKRVGVTANSHKAIHNLLHAVEEVAEERGLDFSGLKKCSGGEESRFTSRLADPRITSTEKTAELNDRSVLLTAGTAWHFCRDDVERVDYLFVDEAGQVSTADALALSTAAENIVLLGDPQQLPQVAQGRHPEGAGLSILEHLLAGHQTIPPDRGVFLDKTWRLHPEIADFVSGLMYEGRLGSAPDRERQSIHAPGSLTGAGLRWLPVEHRDRSQASPEEAAVVADNVESMLSGAAIYTDADGIERALTVDDILVVSPYNAHVRCLQDRLPAGVRVGTVDKFQGQEAPVVFFSMATSSGEDIPRNIEFLFSLNRLNVAISRARALAILVASPRLLEIEAKSVEQMRLANAICRYVEIADLAHEPIA